MLVAGPGVSALQRPGPDASASSQPGAGGSSQPGSPPGGLHPAAARERAVTSGNTRRGYRRRPGRFDECGNLRFVDLPVSRKILWVE
eukprot:8029636-Lingulodinium_polyedra.AAC.1